MILLDTNVLSELMRRKSSPEVVKWVNKQSITSLFTSSITQAEIFYGLALLEDSHRRDLLLVKASAMFEEDFDGRILSFDTQAAFCFAEIVSNRKRAGKPISQMDAQIAAIAKSRGARIATRNVNDFQNCGVKLINPWEA